MSPKPIQTGARKPLTAALALLDAQTTGSFAHAEQIFLEAMWAFDQMVVSGVANQGDIQNGKGDFFNDFVSRLLTKGSGKSVHTRPNVKGRSFRNHKLDAAWPQDPKKEVKLVVETKATGVPKHARNTLQKNPEGRRGSADLDKRVKEAAFKNIDIKAELARAHGVGGGATSDLTTWLKSAPPRCYLFLAVRVVDANDLKKAVELAIVGTAWFDGCGLFCYGKNKAGNGYEAKLLPHTTIELDVVLSDTISALKVM